MRSMILIMFALCIDGLQAALSFTFFAMSMTTGSIAGCALGSQAAGKVGCFLGGLVGTLANGALLPLTGPIGIVLGIGANVVVSLMLGGGLIVLLAFNGMFYPAYIFSAGIFEIVPGIDNLPSWTIMVILCIMQKNAEEGKGSLVGGAARTFATTLTPMGVAGTAYRAIKEVTKETTATNTQSGFAAEDGADSRPRLSTNLRSIDGVRPAPLPVRSSKPYAA